jgi:hypothetical protein
MPNGVPAELESLLLSVGVLHIMTIGLAHILGGSAWSGRVARAFLRFYRGLLALPFTLMARILTAIGSAIRGGGSSKKKGK